MNTREYTNGNRCNGYLGLERDVSVITLVREDLCFTLLGGADVYRKITTTVESVIVSTSGDDVMTTIVRFSGTHDCAFWSDETLLLHAAKLVCDNYLHPLQRAAGSCSSMAFNWRAFEAWRSHPMLTNNFRHGLPGLGIGSAAFAVYVLYDKTIGSGSKGETHH